MDTATPTLAPVPLDADLAKRLNRVAAKVDRDIEELNSLLILAFVRGASLRDIADEIGLTHVGVKKRIDRVQNDFEVRDADGKIIAVGQAKTIGMPDLTEEQILRRGDPSE